MRSRRHRSRHSHGISCQPWPPNSKVTPLSHKSSAVAQASRRFLLRPLPPPLKLLRFRYGGSFTASVPAPSVPQTHPHHPHTQKPPQTPAHPRPPPSTEQRLHLHLISSSFHCTLRPAAAHPPHSSRPPRFMPETRRSRQYTEHRSGQKIRQILSFLAQNAPFYPLLCVHIKVDIYADI